MLSFRRLDACAVLALLTWTGCGNSNGMPTPGTPQQGAPATGATEFISADTQSAGGDNRSASHGESAQAGGVLGTTSTVSPPTTKGVSADASATAPGGDPGRAVERGDVFRVLPDHRILNLNRYRGLQVIDISNVDAPKLEGRLAVTGDPVELYVVGERAIVLLNNWQGYYGTRDDVKVQSVTGGLVMSVDLSDRTHPALLDQATVPGNISTSRLTQGGKLAALYVAANDYDQTSGQSRTVLKSFDVTGDTLAEKNELDLGGYVQDIQATSADVLLVASQNYSQNQNYSLVSLVDISSPDGTMVQGGTVLAAGLVQNKFNMDAYNGILRVVSGANFGSSQENHLETFDMSDLAHPVAIDHCRFAPNEQLYATLFLENRGFFVTYLRKDPFHAFAIDDKGHCQEHSEFVVSGWNDFLRQTLGDTRLVGVGHNDENRMSQLSVSLYDASSLTNPNPLLARADIDLAYSYSQANWDDRAFTVVEDAVSALAQDGTKETGLVLLPYEGWDQSGQKYVAEVQIFSFSDHTLTLRGSMNHGSAVNRSFVAGSDTEANLSDEQLSLFGTKDADAPVELGRLEIAPNYSQLLVFGDYVARVKDRSYYASYSADPASAPKMQVEILPRSANLDADAPVTTLEVPSGSELIKAGSLLVSATTTQLATNDPNATEAKYTSTIAVYDLSDPAHPQQRATLDTDRIRPGYGGGYYGGDIASPGIAIGDCLGKCGGYSGYTVTSNHYAVGDAIAFVRMSDQQKSLGMVHECSEYAPGVGCAGDSSGNVSCPQTQITGGITCRTPQGGKETCSGGYYACDSMTGSCTPTDEPAGVQRYCNDYENIRYWQAYGFDVLDLRNPDKPSFGPTLDAGKDEEGSSVLADGTRLFFNFQTPYAVSNDGRDRVKHFFRSVDFSDPQKPSLADPINVPGDVIASDGSTIYTRDLVWGDTDAHTLVARLSVSNGLAHLQAGRVFADLLVQAVKLDGHGHVLVSGDPYYGYGYAPRVAADEQPKHALDILDADTLAIAGHADVDSWATFEDAQNGRALYSVSGGVLVFNVEDAAHPVAQAYFPTLGWPSSLYFDGREVMFAAGPYGVYRFDASTYNLLAQK